MSDSGRRVEADDHIATCADRRPRDFQQSSHQDIFCSNCHDWFDEPHVLPNGSDIAWPARWTAEEAQKWRAEHGLARPETLPQAGPHDSEKLANKLATAGTGMLPEPGQADQNDMSPGG